MAVDSPGWLYGKSGGRGGLFPDTHIRYQNATDQSRSQSVSSLKSIAPTLPDRPDSLVRILPTIARKPVVPAKPAILRDTHIANYHYRKLISELFISSAD